ncbi:uncharacterized protein LOC111378329 isoform X1 [Olea europaea var. sylvestris]|uniref:uncharacterized protein LOC111378329 isoform X1 n=1 Tax=Olea europaea var. sylvestris TaxID=158386 RepID=UPI000C1CD22B|nr:uncharacterized protein LOC111378329 isoform X1 [Olea europaea var. sylvestris]
MADLVPGPEYCLPAEFLTDEDFVIENEKFNKKTESVSELCFPTEFPYDFGTYSMGSPETESDEEDLLAELTGSSFYQRLNPTKPQNLEKGWMMSGSPQSTLTQFRSWSGGSAGGSYNGSPNGPSQVPSPPTMFGIKNNKPWELIYQPVVRVPKHKLSGGDLPDPPRSLVQVRYPAQNPNAPVFHNTRFQQVRVDRSMNQPNMGCGMRYGQHQVYQNMGVGLVGGMGQAAYQTRPTQKFSGSGTEPVSFGRYGGGDRVGPGGGGGKRGCAGTGVFLPRRYGANNDMNAFPSDSRKKLASSTALFPDRIIHSLNKNIADVQSQSHYFIPDYDTLMSRRNALLIRQLGLSSSTRSSYPHQD